MNTQIGPLTGLPLYRMQVTAEWDDICRMYYSMQEIKRGLDSVCVEDSATAEWLDKEIAEHIATLGRILEQN